MRHVWTDIECECPDCGGAAEVKARADVAAAGLVQVNDPARCIEDDCDWVGRVHGDDDGVWLC